MIRQIRLKNWRCYGSDEVEIAFNRPVTFFVAPNGVGKSSLYQAARAAIFGFDGPANKRGKAVRAGEERAEIRADVDVDGHELLIERTLRLNGKATFHASLDGTDVSEDEVRALLGRAWGADAALLDRLAFADADPSVRGSGPLPVRDHLAELLGATPLLEAATELTRSEAVAKTRVSTLRATTVDLEAVRAAERAVTNAQRQVEDAEAAVAAHRSRLQAAESAAAAAADWARYRTRLADHDSKLTELLSDVRAVASTADPGGLHDALEAANSAAEADVEAAQATIVELGKVAARADAAVGDLADADVCPTCLRPLTADERDHALRSHQGATDGATAETGASQQRLASARSRSEQIRQVMRRLDRLQPPAPPDGDDPGPQADAALEEARQRAGRLSEQLGEWRAVLAQEQRRLDELRAASESNRELTVAAREEVMLGTVATVMDRLANRILSERLEPVTLEVAHRWKRLFGTDGLELSPDGAIELHVPGGTLGRDDLSGGELVVADVIVRLIVASAVTDLPMVWFDEPLEHLDPRRRVALARTLVAAVEAGPLPSVVITTYEEHIARQLELTNPDLVTVAYANAARPLRIGGDL